MHLRRTWDTLESDFSVKAGRIGDSENFNLRWRPRKSIYCILELVTKNLSHYKKV